MHWVDFICFSAWDVDTLSTFNLTFRHGLNRGSIISRSIWQNENGLFLIINPRPLLIPKT